ncbi:MAG TPA: hypothetical protein VII34_05045 [Pyrinomonadaceae bacterium]
MKRVNVIVVLLVAAGALLLASAKQSVAGPSEYSRSADGLLRMKHSPVLGINIPIAVWIDGVEAGAFAKGHVYQRYLTPGRHDLYASRPGRQSDSWHGTLDVRPGETYSFVVSCTPAQVILSPVSRID